MSIAKTILQQLKAGTDTRGLNGGTTCMGCWGTHALTNTGQGLKFKVNGRKFHGWVEVTLDEGADLYDVALYTLRRPPRKKTGDILIDLTMVPKAQVKKIKQTFEGVYCDQLTQIIDSAVESG